MILNGPSSSGKSSIGNAMLPLLDEPWFFVPVDRISALRSTNHRRVLDDKGILEMLRRTRMGYHRTVAALASVGNPVIMDYPLSEAWRLTDLLEVLDGYDVTLVDDRCSPQELATREQDRGDRPVGLSDSQRVYGHDDRDLVVDTTVSTPDECAGYIVDRLSDLRPPKAFDRLRSRGHNATSRLQG